VLQINSARQKLRTKTCHVLVSLLVVPSHSVHIKSALSRTVDFTFYIPSIMVRLLQYKPTKCTLRNRYINVLIYIYSYKFRSSLAHYQGVYSCIKQSLDLFIIFSMCNYRKFINVWFIEMNMCKYRFMFEQIYIQILWHPYYTSIILTWFLITFIHAIVTANIL